MNRFAPFRELRSNQIQTTQAYRSLFGLHLAYRLLHLPPLYNLPSLLQKKKPRKRPTEK